MVRGLINAATFLTRVPIGRGARTTGELSGSVAWFPVVGGLVGASVGLAVLVTRTPLGSGAAAVIGVGVGMLLTGAFHEDGLGDTFDGLAGGMSEPRRLEIMKDSRLGTFGVAALVTALLLKVALVSTLAAGDASTLLWALAGAGAVGRASAVSAMKMGEPVGSGLGAEYIALVRPGAVALAAAIGVAFAAGSGASGALGLSLAGVAMLVLVRWSRAKIGGVTGDVLGAIAVISELGFLAGVVGSPSW